MSLDSPIAFGLTGRNVLSSFVAGGVGNLALAYGNKMLKGKNVFGSGDYAKEMESYYACMEDKNWVCFIQGGIIGVSAAAVTRSGALGTITGGALRG